MTLNPINLAWWMGLPTDPLSHVGLSVAAVFAVHYLLRKIFVRFSKPRNLPTEPVNPATPTSGKSHLSQINGWTLDYRLVIIGSLLPDLIDKSLELGFFAETFNLPGRSFAHTLLFNSVLVGFSLLILSLKRSFRGPLGPLVFSLSSAGHLFFDRMWESPRTLFWPRYGLPFGHAESHLSPSWLHWMQTGIGPVILDWTGALVLLIFVVMLYRRGSILKWIRSGVA